MRHELVAQLVRWAHAVLGPLSGTVVIQRGIGITELLNGQAPWAVVVLFAVVTQLGDLWLLFILSGVLYVGGESVPRWGVGRRQGMFLLALIAAYAALVVVLKSLFMLPRPPGAAEPPALRWIPPMFAGVFTSATTASGMGFPSGHALGSTVVWGGLALVLDRSTFRKRVGVAGVVVVLVSVSRLVLGVHYAVDVLVGAGIGMIALVSLYWLSDQGLIPERVLLVAVVLSGLGLLTGVTFSTVAVAGGAVGGWLAWWVVGSATSAHPSTRHELVAAIVVILLAGGLFGAMYLFQAPHTVTFLGTACTAGMAVAAPWMGERLT
jgi:membrane-associated phospholipid phosphatase